MLLSGGNVLGKLDTVILMQVLQSSSIISSYLLNYISNMHNNRLTTEEQTLASTRVSQDRSAIIFIKQYNYNRCVQ
jgi:hypothetical protein